MKKILSLLLFSASFSLFGQVIVNRDSEIDQMVKEVNADSLQGYIRSMVAFGTRNTLSTQRDPKRGIGAARKWVLSKFNQFGKQSNGRLTATIDAAQFK